MEKVFFFFSILQCDIIDYDNYDISVEKMPPLGDPNAWKLISEKMFWSLRNQF